MNGGITAQQWNAMVDTLWRKIHLGVTSGEASKWRHPWHIAPLWNDTHQRWEADIKPGLVNGDDATVLLRLDEAPEATKQRLKDKELHASSTVDAKLSEGASLLAGDFRSIGPDAAPTGVSTGADGGSAKLTFEAVPLFFQVRGVGPPPKISGDLQDGISQEDQATPDSRLLRALDVVLYKDRPATASTFQQSDGTDGTLFQYSVTAQVADNARRLAYLRTTPKYSPPPPDDPLARLLGDWSDTPRDQMWMASVYLMSPEGAAYESAPDGTWQPFVHHRVFWNLHHGMNQLEPPLKNENLVLHTGLAAGVGDRINDFLLAQVNDANSALAQFVGRNTIAGRFWSV